MADYPLAEKVSIDARMEALAYVIECVKQSYGEDQIALRNVAALVDGVADAVVSGDMQLEVVRGLRLLDVGELANVVAMLRKTAPLGEAEQNREDTDAS